MSLAVVPVGIRLKSTSSIRSSIMVQHRKVRYFFHCNDVGREIELVASFIIGAGINLRIYLFIIRFIHTLNHSQ